MAIIALDGVPAKTNGELPAVGSVVPDFTLTGTNLQDVNLASFAGKVKIISLFPSMETGVCAKAAAQFNERASQLADTVVLSISADLPFAAHRACSAGNLKNIIPLSTYRYPDFATRFGVLITDGAFKGLLARAVLVVDRHNKVRYAELVKEIAHEPAYDAVLAAAKSI